MLIAAEALSSSTKPISSCQFTQWLVLTPIRQVHKHAWSKRYDQPLYQLSLLDSSFRIAALQMLEAVQNLSPKVTELGYLTLKLPTALS